MALQPTAAQCTAIVDVTTLAVWCEINGTAPANTANVTPPPTSDAQALFGYIQCGPQEHYRCLAMVTTADWATQTQAITINGVAPSMMLRAKINLFHATARRLSNLDPWPMAALTPPGVAAPTTAQLPPGSVITPARVNLPVLNVGRVLDQRMNDEITYLEPDKVIAMNAAYVKVMEQMPPVAKSVTLDQLTALHYTIRMQRPPNADFAVFGKHGHRRARAMAFTGVVTAPGGTMHTIEILGPPTLEAWKESYDCLYTALIMLDAVRRPALDAYRAKICSLHAQYGPRCWALLYQADARCRAEHMERLRFIALAAHNAAIAAQQPSTFDTSRPWDTVWHMAVKDTEFWETEFKDFALFIRTGTIRTLDVLGNDASIAQSSTDDHHAGPAAFQRPKPQQPKAQPKANAKGVCKNFNQGKCHGASCPRGHGQHKCSICGAPKHGAVNCPQVGQDPNQSPANDKARDQQWGKGKKNKGARSWNKDKRGNK
jgi:hypothetical protein